MDKAGWLDLWHLAVALIAKEPAFLQIMCWTGAVFVIVMAVEGVRTSVLSIWHGHRQPPQIAPPAPEPVVLAAPSPIVEVPVTRHFSVRSVPRAAATPTRKRKPLTIPVRRFTSPRPTIRRHVLQEVVAMPELPNFSAESAVFQHEGV